MLRTRILTAAVLACLLLAGLFLLPRPWSVLAFGAVFTIGAFEWGAFGALHGLPARLTGDDFQVRGCPLTALRALG